MGLRKCSKCGVEKELSPEHFYRSKREALGFVHLCKPCSRVYLSRWRKENPDKARAQKKRYFAKYPEKKREAKKRQCANNLESWRASLKRRSDARRARNPEKYRTRGRAQGQKQAAELADVYVKKLLVHATSLPFAVIPQELVEVKRLQLLLHREVKKREGK